MGIYPEATSKAPSVTTRLSMDAHDASDLYGRAEASLASVSETLFQLDRIAGFSQDAYAAELADELRERISSLAETALRVSKKPVNPIRYSVESRILHIANETRSNKAVLSRTEDDYSDCVD